MRRELATAPALGSQGGVIGRPRAEPPEGAAELIEDLAADGWSVVGIAWKLGVSREVFGGWLDRYPELLEAFEVGRERERQCLHNKLYRIAMEGASKESILAASILLNSRHGYRRDTGDQGNRVNIVFNLPGPMSRDEFMKTLVSADG